MVAPETRYTQAGDVHVAYQVFGEGELDVVVVPGFLTHVELVWATVRACARGARVVRARDDLRPPRLGPVRPVASAPSLEERWTTSTP